MGMTNYLKNSMLEDLFRGVAYSSPSVVYIALSKTAPTELGTNCTEPSTASYERLSVTSNEVNWAAAVNGSLSNSVALRFPEAEESWTSQASPITHWAIFDAPPDGNMLFFGSLSRSQEIPRGSILEIPESGLVTTIINQ